MMTVYATRKNRNRWPIGRSNDKPTLALIRRAGIDPESVEKIELVKNITGKHWLVTLKRTT